MDKTEEKVVQIAAGGYRSSTGNLSHMLYALCKSGRLYKLTRDGWVAVPGPTVKEEAEYGEPF